MNWVHNHGPAEGKGLDCPEYDIADRLVGHCLLEEAGFQRKPIVCWATIAGNAIAEKVNLETELAKVRREQRHRQAADQGKGSFVAAVQNGAWDMRFGEGDEYLTTLQAKDGTPVTDFEEAVLLAEEQVRNGYSAGTAEVVEMAVVRRAVVKRSVEVSVS